MATHSLLKSILFFAATLNPIINTQPNLVVSHLENKSGKLFIGWYDSEENFEDKKDPVFTKVVEVKNQSEISIPFDNIPVGKYAISIFLDENGNKKMDKNFIGIPKEKYGFSNNVIPATRAANFEEAVFEIDKKTKMIAIRLK
jgi:uncharacterized protein (DUF2141 family)